MASIDEGVTTTSASFMDNFSCKICLEILDKPMQCQRNEHYFCTSCITKHLKNSNTCPLCMEELTMETLQPPSRMILNVLSQLKTPLCKYAPRGCKEEVKVEELVHHHEVCGFAPTVCPNEGCGETVNRKELASHKNDCCKMRKVMCEQCQEEMTFFAFEMHPCYMRSEVNELKSCVAEMKASLTEIQKYIKEVQDPLRNVDKSSLIFVAGGCDQNSGKSFEIFNWSTKTWCLYEDKLFFWHSYSFSFLYKDVIMLCGGQQSNKIEYVKTKKDPGAAFVFPVALQAAYGSSGGKGAVCGNQLFTFYGGSVNKIVLDPPGSVQHLLDLNVKKSTYGVECVNKKIVVVGGHESLQPRGSRVVNTVYQYDVIKNTIETLAPLPHAVSYMATVCYNDNIIMLGGCDSYDKPINSVVMYNITTQESRKLPSMLEKRSECTAVIIGDAIVVMGGRSSHGFALKTVEYHVLGQSCWNKLPDMHLARQGATSSVQV